MEVSAFLTLSGYEPSEWSCTCTCLNTAGAADSEPSLQACTQRLIFHSSHLERCIYSSTCTEKLVCVPQPELLFHSVTSSYSTQLCANPLKWSSGCYWSAHCAPCRVSCSSFVASQHLGCASQDPLNSAIILGAAVLLLPKTTAEDPAWIREVFPIFWVACTVPAALMGDPIAPAGNWEEKNRVWNLLCNLGWVSSWIKQCGVFFKAAFELPGKIFWQWCCYGI